MRFVILGDLHFSDYPNTEQCQARDRLFTAFFKQIAAYEPAIIFAVGDTTNKGTIAELEGLHAVAKACDVPLFGVTGNHDLYGLEKEEIAAYFLGGQPSASATELYTAFDAGLVRFVVLDTARVKMSSVDWSGFVSKAQLSWLRDEIAKFNAGNQQYLMVLGHHPIFGTTRRSDEPMLNIANSEAVHQIFTTATRQPAVYFCGHNHNHSIFGPDDSGWYFVQTAAPLDCRSFRLVDVTENGVVIQTMDFDLSQDNLQADFDVVRTSIPASFSPKEFADIYGTPADRELTLTAPLARRLDLAGSNNLRDIGGYLTADGHTTRWRTLFRSDALHRLTPEAQQAFLTHGIHTIIDLRRPLEVQEAPNPFAANTSLNYNHMPIHEDEGVVLESGDLGELYRRLLAEYQPQFRQILARLAEPEAFPALVHCSAGKDRTGLVIALLLSLAGVPDSTIADDYALTAEYLKPRVEELRVMVAQQGRDMARFEKLMEAKAETMLATLEYLDTQYGGAEGYLKHIGLTDEQIVVLRQAILAD